MAQNRDDTNEKRNKKQTRAQLLQHSNLGYRGGAGAGGIVIVKKICGKSNFKLELKQHQITSIFQKSQSM